jgi:hypothetical protein
MACKRAWASVLGSIGSTTTGGRVTLVVRVRNVGKKEVKFQYCPTFFWQWPPAATDAKGKPGALGGLPYLADDRLQEVNLAPGKSIELHQLQLSLRSATEKIKPTLPGGVMGTFYEPGKFTIQYKQHAGDWSSSYLALSKLATGRLELEVRSSDPPRATEDPAKPKTGKGKKDIP